MYKLFNYSTIYVPCEFIYLSGFKIKITISILILKGSRETTTSVSMGNFHLLLKIRDYFQFVFM